jgi:hypothetical protein
MKRLRMVFSILVLTGGMGVATVPAFATAALAKKEKLACAVCHTSKVPSKDSAGLNAVGKCYEREKSMANCGTAGKPSAAVTAPAASVAAAAPNRAQPAAKQTATTAAAQQSMASGMPESCRSMMAKHAQMMEGMKAMEAALDQKVAAMNASTGVAKTDAMAGVITELVSQRKLREHSMMTMQSSMMEHMSSHMVAGKHEATTCPMMTSTMASKASGGGR